MRNDLISVIVPIYNTQEFLAECLESIKKQSYSNFEVILIDDGSTDNSHLIYNEYLEDTRFKLIKTENKGLSCARNTGLSNAKGKYIVTIDSDDFVDEYFIEHLHDEITIFDSDICLCKTKIIDDMRILSDVNSNNIQRVTKITKEKNINEYSNLVEDFHMSDSWNKMYKRKFVESTGVTFSLDKSFNGTDLLFNHKIMLHEPQISFLMEELYFYRIRFNSQVRRKNRKLLAGFLEIISQLLIESRKLEYDLRFEKQIYKIFVTFLRLGLADNIILNEINTKLLNKDIIYCQQFQKKVNLKSGLPKNSKSNLIIFSRFYRLKLVLFIKIYLKIFIRKNKLKNA